MAGDPPLDVVDPPDLALRQDRDRFREVRAGRQPVDPLPTDAQQFPDFTCAGQARRLAVHAHVVVCKSDGSAYGGHLLEGFVRPTLEMNVSKFPVMVERTLDAEAKIPLIDVKQTRERLKAA